MPILTFPETRQATVFSCGASAVQSVLYYYGIEKREDELAESLGTSEEEGVTVGPIIEFLRGCDLRVCAGEMTLDHLKSWIDAGVPVILMVQAWADGDCDYSSALDEGHYVVAIGYDDERVIFDDPSLLGNRGFMTFDELESRWHDIDEGDQVLDHYGVAVWGPPPAYDPEKLLHIASKVAVRWTRRILHQRRVNRG